VNAAAGPDDPGAPGEHPKGWKSPAGESRSASSFPDVVAITDPALCDDELAERTYAVLRAVPRASVGVQLRDRRRMGRAILGLAERLKSICAELGAPLYVNDRLDVALATAADGVHLGGGSVGAIDARRLLGSAAFVSIAAHRIDDLDHAATTGVTAALFAPIFSTPGKGPPSGTAVLSEARARAPHLRLYALGGVDAERAPSCIDAGADGVAVVRALWQATDPAAVASSLVEAVRRAAALRKK
jgi:thiamine-phosphate diphosphorylase